MLFHLGVLDNKHAAICVYIYKCNKVILNTSGPGVEIDDLK